MKQVFQQDSHTFDLLVESGYKSIEGRLTLSVLVRKPDLTTFSKNLTDDDFYPKTNQVRIPVSSGNLDQEGIYDYQVTDSTNSKAEKGQVLQFSIRKKIT